MSATDDKILGAPGQDQPFILGQVADIAGDQPTCIRQYAKIVRRIDVAWKHLRTLNKHQAARERGALLGGLVLAAECGN